MKYKLMVANNLFPAIILMADFFINCVPFIFRHFFLYFIIEVAIVLESLYENYGVNFDNPFEFT